MSRGIEKLSQALVPDFFLFAFDDGGFKICRTAKVNATEAILFL
jgi:hypothetical protein